MVKTTTPGQDSNRDAWHVARGQETPAFPFSRPRGLALLSSMFPKSAFLSASCFMRGRLKLQMNMGERDFCSELEKSSC